jgi:hypothetical protein
VDVEQVGHSGEQESAGQCERGGHGGECGVFTAADGDSSIKWLSAVDFQPF